VPRESELFLVAPKYGRTSGDACLREQKMKVDDLISPLIPDENYEGAMVLFDIISYEGWNTLVKLLPHEGRERGSITTWLSPSTLSSAASSHRQLRRPVPIFVSHNLHASGQAMTKLDAPPFIPPQEVDREEEIATAQLLNSPPRKRSRKLDKSEVTRVSQCHPAIVHDEDYYLSDGNCIILVENTLFNVSVPVSL
jgi:hypothetical protein